MHLLAGLFSLEAGDQSINGDIGVEHFSKGSSLFRPFFRFLKLSLPKLYIISQVFFFSKLVITEFVPFLQMFIIIGDIDV